MADRSSHNNQNNFAGWILPIVLLIVFPPLGFLFLMLKIFTAPKKVDNSARHPYYTQQERDTPIGARTTAGVTHQTAESRQRQEAEYALVQKEKLSGLDQKGKRLVIVGGVMTGIFGITSVSSLSDAIHWFAEGYMSLFSSEVSSLLLLLCFTGAGIGLLWAGLKKRKQVSRFRRYLNIIGARQSAPIEELASTAGCPRAKTLDDLDDMLNSGLFPQGFLDHKTDRLILSQAGYAQASAPKKKEEPKEEKKDKDGENAILSEIKEINDEIDDEKLSAQIDRIGVVTAKILEYQKSRPEKAPQLHSFLSYYLPTTLKILRAYAKLEDQDVKGENITAAMSRIEGMMDKVVEGFEKQLDMLFQGDAMDITSDVEVLERMMAKDGLSDPKGINLKL